MNNCILCRRKTAKIPFHIESVSLNLYSAEELCYFIANYLPLAGEVIEDGGLIRWMEEECSMPGTADIIKSLLTGRSDTQFEALKIILKNTNYYSTSELAKIFERMDEFQDKREIDKKMERAAVLMKNRKYKSAIADYEAILKDPGFSGEPEEFRGKLNYNLGCACTKLFKLKAARSYFEKALELIPCEKVRKADMAAAYLEGGIPAFNEAAKKTEASIGERGQVLSEINALKDPEISEDLNELAARWIRDYHESTGL